jgi:4-hydroxybenzoate polyprenyltransferase
MGWAAHTGSLTWAPVLLYVAGICWTLFYDTIYAHQDKEDDALIGVKSTARLFGENTYAWLLKFQVGTIIAMTFAVLLAILEIADPITLSIALIGIWAFGWHMTWQIRRLDIDNPENCLKLFRESRDAGLIPVAFWGLLLILGSMGIGA